MVGINDFITEDNVVRTYPEGKYICFVLYNGIIIKINPNQLTARGDAVVRGGK